MAYEVYRCPKCPTVQRIYRPRGQRRKKGHVKSLWCYRCKSKLPFAKVSK